MSAPGGEENVGSWRWGAVKDEEEAVVVESEKATDATEVVAVEKVAAAEEDVVAIQISPATPGTVLIFEIFIEISSVLIGMIFSETVKHFLSVNADVQSLVAGVVMTVNARDMEVA